MNHTKLTSTHKKLTFLFTGMVWSIIVIFWIWALSAKYVQERRQEKIYFLEASNETLKLLQAQKIISERLPRTFLMGDNFSFWNLRRQMGERQIPLSYIILDENNKVIQENILENPDFGNISLTDIKGYTFQWNIFLRLDSIGDKKILFFKSLSYTWLDLVSDIILLCLVSLILSELLYFLWYRFVGRALKPVEENLQDMSDFIHNAGHELKTPLAVMRGNLQIMQAEKSFDEKLVLSSIVEVDHINMLIESLRELSEVGKNSQKEWISLSEMIVHIFQELESYASERNISLSQDVSTSFFLSVNPHELKVLLSNIIKNAIKYNTSEGRVDVILEKNILSIKDTWRWIPKAEQDKIFERFYQWTTVRSEEGFGIGLSLVKKIADANNWKILLKSEVWQGTEFQIVF